MHMSISTLIGETTSDQVNHRALLVKQLNDSECEHKAE